MLPALFAAALALVHRAVAVSTADEHSAAIEPHHPLSAVALKEGAQAMTEISALPLDAKVGPRRAVLHRHTDTVPARFQAPQPTVTERRSVIGPGPI